VTLVSAESGTGKTSLALYWSAATGLRTLYFSADSDDRTMMERAGAMVTGHTMTTVKQMLYPEPDDDITDELHKVDQIRFVFESDPSYNDLLLEVQAYTEAYGDFPEIIVLDNVANVAGEQEDEYRSMRDTTRALHRLGRMTHSCVIALHHVKEEDRARELDHPPPKRAIKGKVSDFPEQILTGRIDDESQTTQWAPVKDRFGKSDKSGRTYVELFPDFERSRWHNSWSDRRAGIPS